MVVTDKVGASAMRLGRRLYQAWVSALIMALTAGTAWAAEARKLRVADSFPKGHYLVKLVLEPWMTEVTKRTNGAITFEHFPAQQLGKATDMLTLTQTGVADIGYVAPSYNSDKMAASEVAQLPGAFETSCQGTLAYWKIARDGVVAAQDYAPNKIRLLLAVALPQYHILTVKEPVRKVDDARGLKLRTTGGAQDLTLRAIGAVPVRMAAPDAYESLSRGTLDGLLFPLESVIAYGTDKLVKFSTEGVGFGSFIVAYSISDAAWNRLEPDVQKVMRDVAEEVVPNACREVQNAEAETMRKLESTGVKFEVLSADAQADFRERLKDVNRKWAEGLDARGKKGSDALKDYEAAVHAIPAQ